MSLHPSLVLLLLACPCGGGLPDGDADNTTTQTQGTDDTAQADTAPPAACAQPETEFNGSYSDATPIVMEEWACGGLDAATDTDFLTFESPYDGWLKIRVNAATIGSSSDMRLLFGDGGSQYNALNLSQRTSTDPKLVVPAPGDTQWYAILSEQYGGYGEEHYWQFHASMTKAPTEWDTDEVEDNDSVDTGNQLSGDERVFGQIESGSDQDWFIIEVEEDELISLAIEAQEHGSPFHAEMSLYKPDGTRVRRSSSGGTTYDQDPVIEYTATQSGAWGVLVQYDSSSQTASVGGSLFYWYVLDVFVSGQGDTGI
jgi:hypothetical protein